MASKKRLEETGKDPARANEPRTLECRACGARWETVEAESRCPMCDTSESEG